MERFLLSSQPTEIRTLWMGSSLCSLVMWLREDILQRCTAVVKYKTAPDSFRLPCSWQAWVGTGSSQCQEVRTWCLFCEAAAEETPAFAMADEKPKEGVKTENNDHINLKVAGQDGSVVQFKIKRHTPLSKLVKAYCERQGLSMRQIRFRFDGQSINERDTPAQLEMEDEDTIDVFQQQTGGVY
ncbi:Small ubiquitin-related modifier 2 [Microtus ochrogaster]|uniref:Small ubiquitin-related modifier 2 n=1 Tax=Microtus ochrogaster TaxID=79684 RepID=A0A8J6L594_MICOH|nr:Small ubiquitin-related modifier 2 [Microtus ochrogaster]